MSYFAFPPRCRNDIRGEGPGSQDAWDVLDAVLCELRQLKEEVMKMANNDAALTQVVSDLVDAFTANTTAVEAEIAALQKATTPGDDPVVDTAIFNLQSLVTTIKQSTAAAQAAIAPAPAPAAPASVADATGTSDAAASTT